MGCGTGVVNCPDKIRQRGSYNKEFVKQKLEITTVLPNGTGLTVRIGNQKNEPKKTLEDIGE